jgi:hypothetical protein
MGDCIISLLAIINIFLGNLFIYLFIYLLIIIIIIIIIGLSSWGYLLIEVFECLHKQVDVFLFDCVNVIWSFKRLEDSFFSVLVFFFKN